MPVERLSDGTEQAPFQYDFALDAKAVEQTVDENGDLWIQGYASDWGVDRQEEAFEPGSFERGLKSYLERNPIMLYHHQYDKALGQFVDARVDAKGLWVKGRVDKPASGSWAEDVFNKIAKGTIRSFSVGGIFKRRQTPNGPRIYDVDLGEISVTPLGINPRTTFALVANKAFETKADEVVTPPAAEVVIPAVVEEEAALVPEVTPEAVVPEVEEKPEEIEEVPDPIADASITGVKIAPGAISTEHLADDLRSRFSELAPEAPSVEAVQERLGALAEQLGRVFNHIGMAPPAVTEDAPAE